MGELQSHTLNAERPQPPRLYRWVVLLFLSVAMAGNYYAYDSISPLADVLKQQLGFSDSNIGLLNAIYSIPNVFMVLIGGFLIDRIGTKRATFIFGVLCLLGAALTAATDRLAMMAAGRLVFGMGAESLIVSVTTALAKWFRGKELSFAFGLNLTLARLGSFVALNSPTWAGRYTSTGKGPCCWRSASAAFAWQAPSFIGSWRATRSKPTNWARLGPPTRWCGVTSLSSANPIGTLWPSASPSIRLSFPSRPLR